MRIKEVVDISSYGPGGRKNLRRRMLRVIAPIGFVIVILAAMLSITAYSYYSNRRDALTLSNDLLGAIERRIAKELESFVIPVEDAVRLTAAVLENTSFDISNRTLLEPLAFKVLDNLSQISIFNAADTRGNFFMVKKMPNGSYHTKIIDRTQKTTQVTWIRRDPTGQELEAETSIDDSYDPRNRPWYVGALESRQVYWTDFYIFFTDQKYGITVSLPITDPEDQLLGVLGLDIELQRISKFLETLKIGRSGRAVVVDEDGELVAHPEIEKMVRKEGDMYKAVRIDELKDPVLTRAYSRFQVEGHGYRNLIIDDRRYLTSAFFFPTKIGHELTVFIIVPEDDFVGFVNRNNRTVLLMSLSIFVLTAVMAGLMVFQGLRADRNAQFVLDRQNELEAQSRAFAELSSQAALFDAADPESLSRLTEIVSKSIGVRRTSVWQFNQDGGMLRCIDCYDRESDGHTQDTRLTKTEFRHLFDVLQVAEDILAPDAGGDDRIAELYRVYLQPLGCESFLAVPIRQLKETAGWLWFEHDQLSRNWSSEEISFARAIANMLALRFSADQKSISTSAAPIEDTAISGFTTAPAKENTAAARETRSESHLSKPDMTRPDRAQKSTTETGRLVSFAERVMSRGLDLNGIGADLFNDTTVFLLRFTDPAPLAERMANGDPITAVDHLLSHLEDLAASLGIDYMKVMGDEIVCAAGMHQKAKDHPRLMAELALGIQDRCSDVFAELNTPMEFRIGLDTGGVMGSPVGRTHKAYNIWGEAVRFASMMAKTGISGSIQVSETTYRRLRSSYLFQARGRFYLPNIGETSTYIMTGRI
ncbi:MAG: adenylate/guanylate cyclase domain-containing protein [Desulfobacterales bacterium]